VTWNGRDLYAEYAQLRFLVGLVPQEDILHRQLTVRRALHFAAQLRLPPDTSATELEERVDQVIAEVDLTKQMNQRIDSLSGGQRKRTSIALELLTAPQLLFLDEPTSGLDPGLDKQVMGSLRSLADAGRVVLVVTHSVLA
jgi:ABC-type multidrug transport system ATPase subunit